MQGGLTPRSPLSSPLLCLGNPPIIRPKKYISERDLDASQPPSLTFFSVPARERDRFAKERLASEHQEANRGCFLKSERPFAILLFVYLVSLWATAVFSFKESGVPIQSSARSNA